MSLLRNSFAPIIFALLCGTLQASTDQSTSNKATTKSATTKRIIAVGDVHGALEAFESLLRGVGLINQQNQWTGGQTTLVSLGDLVDRGPNSRAVMDLLRNLQGQAKADGGRVAVLLGNHEVMNLTGELRDVSDQEIASHQGLDGHRAAFASNGEYGKWLLDLPVILQIQDTIFVHGGLSTLTADMTVEKINQDVREALSTLLKVGAELRAQGLLPATGDLYALSQPSKNPASDLNTARAKATSEQRALIERFVDAGASPLLGEMGPLWYRGNAGCHPLLEQQNLAEVLDKLNAKRIVVGHTPTTTRTITSRMEQSAYSIDTGMLSSVYRGRPFALEIQGKTVIALDANGNQSAISTISNDNAIERQLMESGVINNTKDNQRELKVTSNELSTSRTARFRALSKRAANRTIAAYRLDQILGLNMVPAAAKRELESKQGVLEVVHRHWTDRQRQQDERYRPNYCANGSAYLLLAAFDALIGKTDRDANEFGYQRRDWRIVAWNNHKAFGTSTKLPRYNQQPTLSPGMRMQLKELNLEQLTEMLGDLLKPKEITALIKRRDLILKWPNTP